MSISKRFGAFAAIGLAGVGALVLAPIGGGAASPAPINVSTDHVTCTTMYGSMKFLPGIGQALLTPPPNPMTSTVKFTLDGCTDTDNANVKLGPSKLAGTVLYSDNGAAQLLGKKNVTATLTITWKTASGAAKLTAPTSTLTYAQMTSALTSLTTGPGAFSGTYGMFSIGTAAAHGGNTAPSVSGNFAGVDGGASSFFDGIASQDVLALTGPATSGKGLKTVNIGVGQIHLG